MLLWVKVVWWSKYSLIYSNTLAIKLFWPSNIFSHLTIWTIKEFDYQTIINVYFKSKGTLITKLLWPSNSKFMNDQHIAIRIFSHKPTYFDNQTTLIAKLANLFCLFNCTSTTILFLILIFLLLCKMQGYSFCNFILLKCNAKNIRNK